MSRSKIAVVVASLAAIAGLVIVIVVVAARDVASSQPAVDQVRIEIRSMPAATIAIGRRTLGTTPLSIYLPSGTQPVEIDAVMEEIRYTLRGKRVRNERQLTRSIVPDHDQVVDFVIPAKP
jgi:hypothetical protein